MRKFFVDPKNLRYSLTTVVPLIVFLTSILAGLAPTHVTRVSGEYFFWVFSVAVFSSICAFVVVRAITHPINELVRKAEKAIKFEALKGGKGQMTEVYQLIEKLVELVRKREMGDSREKAHIMADIERLDYIVPLGYMSLMVVHEVRNPLSTITGMSELLKARVHGEKEWTYIESILEAARKIDLFAGELLGLAEDEEPSRERVDLDGVIREALDALRLEFPQVRGEYVKGDPPDIVGDRARLHQAFYNVLRNAFEYEQRGGLVRVTVSTEHEITVSVFNERSRIAEEDLESVFRPFFSKKKGGRGLGLFISMRNVRMHGGTIAVDSGPTGTTFTISLPPVS